MDVVLCTFNLRPVSTGKVAKVQMSLGKKMYHKIQRVTLREKCPYSELFWSVFSRIRTEYEKILYGISLRIQSKCGKIRTGINPNTNTFHEV